MKKTWLILVVIFMQCLFLVSNAQPKAGFKGGLNYSSISGFEGKSRLNMHAGIFVQYNLSRQWRFQTELIYSGEGQEYIPDEEVRNLVLGYVQVPIMFQYFPTQRFYIEGGPQLAFLTHAMNKGAGEDKLNVKRSLREFQFALDIGFGVVACKRIGFYGRYDFGLTDITLFGDDANHSRVARLGMTFLLK